MRKSTRDMPTKAERQRKAKGSEMALRHEEVRQWRVM